MVTIVITIELIAIKFIVILIIKPIVIAGLKHTIKHIIQELIRIMYLIMVIVLMFVRNFTFVCLICRFIGLATIQITKLSIKLIINLLVNLFIKITIKLILIILLDLSMLTT